MNPYQQRQRAMQRQVINGPEMREPAQDFDVPAPAQARSIDPELPEIAPQFSEKGYVRVYRVERHGAESRHVLIAEVTTFAEGTRIANAQKWQTRVMRFGEPRSTKSNWQPVKVVA